MLWRTLLLICALKDMRFNPGACRPSVFFSACALSFFLFLAQVSPMFAPRAVAFYGGDAQQRPSTMPVVTTHMKKRAEAEKPKKAARATQARAQGKEQAAKSGSSVSTKAARPSPHVAGAQKPPAAALPGTAARQGGAKRPASARGLEGFSTNPFYLEKQYFSPRTTARTDGRPGEKPGENAGENEKRLVLTSKTSAPPDNRLILHRGPFAGGPQTLSYMGKEPSTEVSMAYKVSPRASTRVVVNPQNDNSPLYRPAETGRRVSSGGVYMDVALREDIQLKVGGEYCEVENHQGANGDEKAGQGAAVGLQWDF